jgi:tRNA-specific 2-thiouridylase
MSNKKPRVLMAMSGGVDSSVGAALLKEQGYDVIGVTMQVWDYSSNKCDIQEGNGTCCSSTDVDDARAVCDKLDIPFYVINCESKFKETVIDDFVSNYLKGETPIPCVNCNTYLKFDHLVKKMHELNCDFLATGHYAKIEKNDLGEPILVTSSDTWKDQTYFLFTMDPMLLPRLMFPVGNWQKPELRAYAEKVGLPVAKKKDSTGICFIGPKGYSGFIDEHADPKKIKPGKIKKFPTGEVLGEHKGIHHFTIGQRKGVGIATGTPLHVMKIDADTSTVWMGEESYLYSSQVILRDCHWIARVADGEMVRAKIRFAHAGALARLEKINAKDAILHFQEPQRSVTKGQAAVLYKDKQLLGGGWIKDLGAPVYENHDFDITRKLNPINLTKDSISENSSHEFLKQGFTASFAGTVS